MATTTNSLLRHHLFYVHSWRTSYMQMSQCCRRRLCVQFIYKCFDEGFTGANESGDGKTVESGNDMMEDSRNASLSDFLKSSHYTLYSDFCATFGHLVVLRAFSDSVFLANFIFIRRICPSEMKRLLSARHRHDYMMGRIIAKYTNEFFWSPIPETCVI